jgi:hypothetical protein
MPFGRLFIGMRQRQDRGFGKVSPADLKTDGQAGTCEAAGHRDAWKAENVEGDIVDPLGMIRRLSSD